MKSLSEFALAIQPSSTMAIDAMFKQMKAEGQDVIGFGAGEPDFPTPDHIKEAGIQAIRNNDTRYTPSVGTVELRKAICQRLKADCGLDYDFKDIAVSNGAKTCVYVALRALVNPGDEVILPAPYWVSYIELIRMVGGVPVVIDTTEAEHFKITAEKLSATESAEGELFAMGFTDFRVRWYAGAARLQFPAVQLPRVLERREEILTKLKKYYPAVLLDLEVRG